MVAKRKREPTAWILPSESYRVVRWSNVIGEGDEWECDITGPHNDDIEVSDFVIFSDYLILDKDYIGEVAGTTSNYPGNLELLVMNVEEYMEGEDDAQQTHEEKEVES